MADFEYDIAISFCLEDEELALALADALQGLNVFIYSKAQEEITGTDGMETFIDVFKEKSRSVVLIHRDKWGHTNWTKVEENAIKDYCLQGNWNGLFLVRTQDSKGLPKWVPGTQLYFGLDEFGIDELVGAIKAHAKRQGSEIKRETMADRAKRMATREKFEEETRALMRNEEGVAGARNAVAMMLDLVSESVDSCSSGGMDIKCDGTPDYFVVRLKDFSLVLNWQHYANSVENCPLNFRFFEGTVLLPREKHMYYVFDDPVMKRELHLLVDRVEAIGWCLREAKDSKALAPNEAAELIFGLFLDVYESSSK